MRSLASLLYRYGAILSGNFLSLTSQRVDENVTNTHTHTHVYTYMYMATDVYFFGGGRGVTNSLSPVETLPVCFSIY